MTRGVRIVLDADADYEAGLGALRQRGHPDAEAKGQEEMNILKGVRPLDYVLAAVMVAAAAFIAVENVTAPAVNDLAHPLDSQSALMIPVFVLAALPILWRRRGILAGIGVSFVILAASVPAFGWVTRCGFALPLGVAMAYAVARFAGSRQNHIVGLVGILALQIVTLIKDSSTGGLGALALSLPITAVAYGIGLVVQSRAGKRAVAPTLAPERVHV